MRGDDEGGAAADAPILIVSNRLPITVQKGPAGVECKRSSGGLVAALHPVLAARGGTWVGWPGGDAWPDDPAATGVPYRLIPVSLSSREIKRYYHGFANRTLWPLFHSLIERTRFEHQEWAAYERVNARFAAAVASAWDGEGLAWIHDYHLMRAPLELRRRLPDLKQAFFLHIPFPGFDMFRLLPWDRDLLRGLLACDLIGFHTGGYAQNFLDCVERLLGCRVERERGLIEYGTRTVQARAFPLGIDFEQFAGRAEAAPVSPHSGHRIVLGVDRLDYTKGIPERVRAFEHLLETHPEWRERVVLLQVAVPSRQQVAEYQQLKRLLDEEIGRVNGRFATASWSPIRYLHRSVSPEQLAVLYRDADVALVTPLRDGMNLVAKEYVASQVRDPGVLILSRLAGSAEAMPEALLVNPYDEPGMAAAIHRALRMEEPERRSRMHALRRREERDDVHAWVAELLGAAASPVAEPRPPTETEFTAWLGGLISGQRVVLFLDYDGTLAEIAPRPEEAHLSGDMRRTLQACLDHPEIDVCVVSGRALDDVKGMVGLPGVIYAGNHGLEIEGPGLESFVLDDAASYRESTSALAGELAALAEPGAWVEEKGLTLTYHFRQVPEARHGELARRVRGLVREAGLRPRPAHRAVEARPPLEWDKGRAVLHILEEIQGPDWSERVRVVYAGDDDTDEDAFKVLGGLGATFRIGPPHQPTSAMRHLRSPETLRALLDWVVRFKS